MNLSDFPSDFDLEKLTKQQKIELLELLEEQERRAETKLARERLIPFCHRLYPGFKEGPQHRKIAAIFEAVLRGEKKRVIINIAPRMGKSEFSSYLFPAFFLGRNPDQKIIMATHTASLSEDFGRRVRNLIQSAEYEELFAKTAVSHDQKAAGKWSTAAGGQYYAVGVGGALAGRGADLLLIDDPHALPLDTVVPTPEGWRTIGELKVGDAVYGPDGLPTKVVAKSPVYTDRPLYAVTTDDNEVIYCDAEHKWAFHSETALAKEHLVKVATARELSGWCRPNKPYLPRHAAVRFPERKLPIDPYVLGAWLGDGTSSLGRMTAHPDDAPFVRAQFEAAGYEVTDHADEYSFGVLKLQQQLAALGVLDNKHVPFIYLLASVEQRMALLQGLMDTDGDVTASGQCSFNNTNQRLTMAVRELVHSLGVKAKLHVYPDSRLNHNPIYRVTFKLADCCRMPRKRERTFTPTDKRRRSFRVSATEQRADVQCITVARGDGQFLVGRGYVVTHNSEQDVRTNSKATFESCWAWYQTGPLQRLMPGGAIVVIMTRWAADDLTGRILNWAGKNGTLNDWEVIELPALLPSGASLWPEQWSVEELLGKKNAMDSRYWSAQYMQQPTSEEGALIKREWWKVWPESKPPKVDFIIQSWDTAFTKSETADYSACTTWGVFDYEDPARGIEKHTAIMLLDAFKDRMEFPELKKTALKHFNEWKPDAFIVEAKAAGLPLIHELRMQGIPVQEFTPSRGNDKTVRVNAISDLFSSGLVWRPDTRWATDVAEECAAFPHGDNDDYVDTTTQALLRFRKGGFITLPSDEKDEPPTFKSRSRTRSHYAIG